MPKRQCPFAESNRPQLKTHIGLQELSMGVMGLTTMSNVYDRTLKMMYQNSYAGNSAHKGNIMDSCCENRHAHTAHTLPGQRKLNLSGQFDGFCTNEQSRRMCSSKGQFLPIACSSCCNIPSVAKTCNFCERCLCEFCFRCCHSCRSNFCSDCSTIRQKPGEDERCVCLSCI